MLRAGRFLIFSLLCLLFTAVAPARSQDDKAAPDEKTLEEVMHWLAQSCDVEAHFFESQQIAILKEPIETSGMLYFAPPDLLARHVTEPGNSSVVVRGDHVQFRDETGVATLELGSSEVARALVGNTTLLMRGDLEALRSQYEVSFRTSGDSWTLQLEPKNRMLRKIMERLVVHGRGGKLVSIEAQQSGGDRTLTTFSNVRLHAAFDAEARDRIFSVGSVGSVDDVRTGSRSDVKPAHLTQ